MTKTISQKIVFKNTTASTLYDLYMDAKKHSEITGVPAVISQKTGSDFNIYDGYITGKNLQLIKDHLIVQSWRGNDWDCEDLDSTFIMKFEQKGKDTIIKMTHANVPSKHVEGISKGWHEYYWEPWKNYLLEKR